MFAEELAAAVFMVYRDLQGRWEFHGDLGGSSGDSMTSRASFGPSEVSAATSNSTTSDVFEIAFQSSVEAALRGDGCKKEGEEAAERRLRKVFMALWTTAHL